MLKKYKPLRTHKREIKKLVGDVCSLMGKWHLVFHNLRSVKRDSALTAEMRELVKDAMTTHRELGLSVMPKTHIVEHHAKELEEEMPIELFYTVEEFLEQNHQTGHQHEERVKRIQNQQQRAESKAEKNGWRLTQMCKSKSNRLQQMETENHTTPSKRGSMQKSHHLQTGCLSVL
jgi:hypothetical protein